MPTPPPIPHDPGRGTDPAAVSRVLRAVERKDASTAAHTWRVVLYTRALAEAAGMDHSTVDRIGTAAALHDVGKLDVPDDILQKPGPLTDDEFEIVKRHPADGHRRVLAMGVTDPIVLNLVRHHHERYDGRGYPDGLRGDEIPVGARFFSVIDAFDALTSVRPYRREIGKDAARKAVEVIRAGIGTRYCEHAATLMAERLSDGSLDWVLHYFNDETPAPDPGSAVGDELRAIVRGIRGASGIDGKNNAT